MSRMTASICVVATFAARAEVEVADVEAAIAAEHPDLLLVDFNCWGAMALADDSAQEAFVKAFAALDRFDETQPFAPWLKRIAINAAVDSLRRHRRLEVVHDEDSAFHAWSLSESAEDDLRRWAIADAVSALGAAKRVVVVLHYWLDLPLEEIAGVLGLPIGTVASRLARAKDELRLALEEQRVV